MSCAPRRPGTSAWQPAVTHFKLASYFASTAVNRFRRLLSAFFKQSTADRPSTYQLNLRYKGSWLTIHLYTQMNFGFWRMRCWISTVLDIRAFISSYLLLKGAELTPSWWSIWEHFQGYDPPSIDRMYMPNNQLHDLVTKYQSYYSTMKFGDLRWSLSRGWRMLILIAGVFQRYLALMFVRRLPLCYT